MFTARTIHVLGAAILALGAEGPRGRAHAAEQPPPAAGCGPTRFVLTYDASITRSFSGRVYVMLTQHGREPRFGPSWFDTEPFAAVDVDCWAPEEPLAIDDEARWFPGPPGQIAPGEYAVQAVMRRNLDSPSIGAGPGTAYSEARRLTVAPDAGDQTLRIDRIVPARAWQETARIRVVERHSALLSDFHGRPVLMRATVILPEGYDDDPRRRYPALYWIGGFGSTHVAPPFLQRLWEGGGFADRVARVVLDPSCYGGHHVFADSQNNGPRATALVQELIPHLERTFPLVAEPHGRFLSGHSSGGWSSLWLQVAHPEMFGGVWSLAPDPIDFSDFQMIDLYCPGANMFRDESGAPRPIARRGGRPVLFYEPFARMETVYGDGGQLRSFDWVFSPRGPEGPMRLFDPRTGDVDPAVAEAWKRYDIRRIVEERWEELGPKLAGRITIIAGELDTFYLEGAVRRFAEACARIGSDARIEIVPGADHASFADQELYRRIDRELLAAFEVRPEEAARRGSQPRRRRRVHRASAVAAARSTAPVAWCAVVNATSMAGIASPASRGPCGTRMNETTPSRT
jgi:hypothetical protein